MPNPKQFLKNIYKTLYQNSDLLIVLIGALGIKIKYVLAYEFWYDEAFVGLLMRANWTDFLKEISVESHPPLYYYLMRGWTYIFGINDLSLRSVSVIFSLTTIVVVYLAVKKLFDKESAIFAAILLAISPFLIDYSVEARSYSMYAFFAALSFMLLVYKRYVLFFISLAFLMYSHFFAIMYVGLFLAAYFIWVLLEDKNSSHKKFNIFLGVFCSIGLLAAFYYFLYLHAIQIHGRMFLSWINPATIYNLPKSLMAYLWGVQFKKPGTDVLNSLNFFGLNEVVFGWIGIALYSVGLFLLYTRRKFALKVSLLLSFTFVPLLTLIAYSYFAGESMYIERYFIPSSLFFFITISVILSRLLTFEVRFFVVLLYGLLIMRLATPNYFVGLKDMASSLQTFPHEIVFTSPMDYSVAKYYFDANHPNLRLYEPQDPNGTCYHWAFLSDYKSPADMKTAIFISPEEARMTGDFKILYTEEDFGSYGVYQYTKDTSGETPTN